MGCGNEPNDADDKAVEESINGGNCEPAPELLELPAPESTPALPAPPEAAELDRINEIIQGTQETTPSTLSQEAIEKIEREISSSVMERVIDMIGQNDKITYIPDPSELPKGISLKDIVGNEKPDIIIVGCRSDNPNFFGTKVYENIVKTHMNNPHHPENFPPSIHLHMFCPSPDNLLRMSKANSSIGSDGKPLHAHHLGREKGGPIVIMEARVHQGLFKSLHVFKPDEPIDKETRREFNIQRSEYWKGLAKTYLGPWYEEFLNMFEKEGK
jgi:hypothetical protein